MIDLPEGLIARPTTFDDLEQVVQLVAACELREVGVVDIDREDLIGDWSATTLDLATMSLAVFDGDAMVAEGEVSRGRADVSIHPEHRGTGIGSAILPWVHGVARTQGPDVRQVVSDGAPDARTFLLRHGYEDRFAAWVLSMSLAEGFRPASLPEGFELRAYRPLVDDEEVYQVIEDAFEEWPGRRRMSFEDWAGHTVRRASFRPDDMILAVERTTGAIVGAALLIDTGDDDGWVHQLATRATHRHLGIGRALLHRAFAIFGERGKGAVLLDTNARTEALAFYEKVGMSVRRSYTNYIKDLGRDPG